MSITYHVSVISLDDSVPSEDIANDVLTKIGISREIDRGIVKYDIRTFEKGELQITKIVFSITEPFLIIRLFNIINTEISTYRRTLLKTPCVIEEGCHSTFFDEFKRWALIVRKLNESVNMENMVQTIDHICEGLIYEKRPSDDPDTYIVRIMSKYIEPAMIIYGKLIPCVGIEVALIPFVDDDTNKAI